ncbi:MAG: glycine--tRNA ligase [Patescibacteria group bacterium]
MSETSKLDKIVSLCKRRGFVFPGSDIYGGLANSWDYGHVGNELFNNIASLWWHKFVIGREDMVGIKGAVIMNPKVWEASGHLESFTDPLIECKICHERTKADKEKDKAAHEEMHKSKKETPAWTEPKNFNLLFKTFIGSVEDQKSTAYLRGELAQTMFTDFKLVLDTNRLKLPFGIAQIGKAFRNEITTGNFIFRTKEFTIAELEYFVRPGEEDRYFKEWQAFMENFLLADVGIKKENLQIYEHPKESLAHYSKGTVDFQYRFPWGWDELWGLASRTDYDLKNHEILSGQNLKYKDLESGEEFLPYVVEPTGGVDRLMLAVLLDAYEEDGDRVVLKLHPRLASYKAAVFPLVANKPELVAKARQIFKDLKMTSLNIAWDDRGNIGKRYYSQDEVGTPYCITVDYQTLEDDTVTIRDRDTTKQERVQISELPDLLANRLK